jgi:hypothetical protein
VPAVLQVFSVAGLHCLCCCCCPVNGGGPVPAVLQVRWQADAACCFLL